MIIIAVGLGIVVFLLVGSFVGPGLLHNACAGLFPGVVAGIWAAWPLAHYHNVERKRFWHPQPKEYALDYQEAFGRVRKVLKNSRYDFGDKWHLEEQDQTDNYLMADMRFTQEEPWPEIVSLTKWQSRKRQVKRHLKLEVQFKPENYSTTVQLDFKPEIEGINYAACDSIIRQTKDSIESILGLGTPVGQPQQSSKLPAPPWWLLGLTVFMLLCFWNDIQTALLKP